MARGIAWVGWDKVSWRTRIDLANTFHPGPDLVLSSAEGSASDAALPSTSSLIFLGSRIGSYNVNTIQEIRQLR
jgi:hypothetical protein